MKKVFRCSFWWVRKPLYQHYFFHPLILLHTFHMFYQIRKQKVRKHPGFLRAFQECAGQLHQNYHRQTCAGCQDGLQDADWKYLQKHRYSLPCPYRSFRRRITPSNVEVLSWYLNWNKCFLKLLLPSPSLAYPNEQGDRSPPLNTVRCGKGIDKDAFFRVNYAHCWCMELGWPM